MEEREKETPRNRKTTRMPLSLANIPKTWKDKLDAVLATGSRANEGS
jgi:hypothetical protein